MKTHRPAARSRAFTLAELLVVMGVIAVLLAILLPTLGRAREQARRVKCAANLRALGQALLLYTQDYRHYPGTTLDDGYYNAIIWPVRLRMMLKGGGQEVFYCPSQNPRCEWKEENASPNTIRADTRYVPFGYREGEKILDQVRTFFSYGYNGFGGAAGGGADDENGRMRNKGLGWTVNGRGPRDRLGIYDELPVKFVRKPSQMIAIADTVADGWADFIIHWDLEPGTPGNPDNNPGPLARSPGKIHSGGANVLFCDGHVQWYLQSDLVNVNERTAAGKQMRRMWNNDHRVSGRIP